LVVTADDAATGPTTTPAPTPTPVPGPTLPPAAVGGLTASLASGGAVSLAWSAATGATTYNVYRATVAGGAAGTVFQVKGGLAGTAWTDATALGGTAYRYFVAAANAAGEGPASAAADVTTPAAPVSLGAPQFTASDAPDMTLRYSGGKVTLPDGRVVNVPAGTLRFDNPDVQSHVYKGYAPQNYDGRPYDKRWQDAAANLMPPIDTITLGGPYHMVLADSVVVQSGDGATTYVNGLDYKLNSEWGQVMNANSRLGVWKTGSIQIKYDIVVQRLDLIQLLPDGTVGIKRGKNAPVCPVLPDPDPGAVALAGVHINTIDGARRSGFSVKQRDVYPVAPLPRVAPINPGTIPNTIAKLKAKKDVNIAFFGDSITAGAEASGWFHDRSRTYTSLLTAGIKAAYPGATITETMAHQSGVSATAGGPTWQKYVMDPHNAGKTVDLAIIAMGMNDFGKPSLTPYKDALRGYIAQAKAAGIEVLLVTPIQSNPYYDAVNTVWVPRAQIAQAMREVAAETGVACADAYTEWVNQGSRGVAPVSQLHNWFNHPGNAVMKVIASAIMGHFPGT
ncbi:MAG TPA: GDSL-type esterase/lipase family protein, partial [Humisphaera sp.]